MEFNNEIIMELKLLEVKDVARMLGEKESTVQNWVNRKLKIGKLFIRPGSKAVLRMSDYEQYLKEAK